MTLLKISNLSAEKDNVKILKNLNLTINNNETHIIMGPNGSGKSTLAKILAGESTYKITNGEILFLEKNIEILPPEERLKKGIFLAFQSPIEVAGLNSFEFFHLIFNEQKKYLQQKTVSPLEFLPLIKKLYKKVGLKEDFLNRNFNEGFSGGEKKKNEILQMLLLKPKLTILDEIDSGLDLDALKQTCNILKKTKKAYLIITHNPKFIKFLEPNYIHIFHDGQIKKTGNLDFLNAIEKNGYELIVSKNKNL